MPIFGLPSSFSRLRWTSRDGGAEDFAVAAAIHVLTRAPLIVVGVMLSCYHEDLWVDIHDTLGTILTSASDHETIPLSSTSREIKL